MTDSLGDRVFAIRAALGDKRRPMAQDAFAALLTERSGEKTYYGSDFSNIERNKKPLTLEDVAVIASVDPERRGKLWLGWGEANDATMRDPNYKRRPVNRGTTGAGGADEEMPGKQA